MKIHTKNRKKNYCSNFDGNHVHTINIASKNSNDQIFHRLCQAFIAYCKVHYIDYPYPISLLPIG